MSSGLQRDFVKGNVLDELDELSRRIRILEETLLTTAGVVAARYKTSAAQSIPNSTYTLIDFDTVDFDTHDAVTTGAGWKFTAPVPGYYHVDAMTLFQGTTSWSETELPALELRKNGSTLTNLSRTWGQDSSGGGQNKASYGSTTIYLAVGDTLGVYQWQASGGRLDLQNDSTWNWISIFKI